MTFFLAGQHLRHREDQRGRPGRAHLATPCCSSPPSPCLPPPSASRPSSRCTPGCPTPWPGPPRCRRSSTPPPWSWPASTWSPACTRVFTQAFSIFTPGHSGLNLVAVIGGDHDHHRRPPGLRAARHQEGAGLLHRQPARLHDHGPRGRGVDGGHLPPLHPRLLQGRPLPRGRLGQPRRVPPQLRHEKGHGRAAQLHADDLTSPSSSASLALAGIFPLAGFWSKDEILATAGHDGYTAFMIVGLVGAAMTAAYMTRCVWLTFLGEFRGHGHPHESPRAITVPLVILTVMSVLAGLAQRASGTTASPSGRTTDVVDSGPGPGPRDRGQVHLARPPSSRSGWPWPRLRGDFAFYQYTPSAASTS